MKATVIGVILGAILIAGLFAAARFLPHGPQVARVTVKYGFVGVQRIGPWTLACEPAAKQPPIPFSLTPGHRAETPRQRDVLGRCRVALLVGRKDHPGQIILAANFRLAGEAHDLTMILRFPPLAKKGDDVGVRIGQVGFRLPVAACDAQECLAAGALSKAAQNLLFGGSRAELVFPPGPKGHRPALAIPLAGLSDAIGAMRRAES